MSNPINAKRLRTSLPSLVDRVRKGTRFTAIYRGRPAFEIAPVSEGEQRLAPLNDDPLYHAEAVGESKDGLTAADHDAIFYGR